MRRTGEEKKDDDDEKKKDTHKKKGPHNTEGPYHTPEQEDLLLCVYNCEKREKEHLATQSARTSWLNSPRKK